MHFEVLIHQGLLAAEDLLQLFSNAKGSLVVIVIGETITLSKRLRKTEVEAVKNDFLKR
jgi:hypothetical protein